MPLAYDGWTRKELEAEARRRGLRETERLGRDALVRLLRGESVGIQRNRDRLATAARTAVVGAVSEVRQRLPGLSRIFARPARSALGAGRPSSVAPSATGGEARPRETAPPYPPPLRRAPFPAEEPSTRELLGMPDRGSEPSPPTMPSAAPSRSFRPPPAARGGRSASGTWLPPPPSAFPPRLGDADGAGSPSTTPPASAAETVPPPATFPPPASVPPSQPAPGARSGPPPHGAREREVLTAGDGSEPIRTRTFARLLADQGHPDRALALLQALADEGTEDAELRWEIDRLRRLRENGREPPTTPPPAPTLPPIALGRLEGGRVELRWTLTEAGATPGRHLAGPGASLTARLVAITPDMESVIANQVFEREVEDLVGSTRFEGIPARARLTAAIGWRARGRFVSVAHVRGDSS